MTTTSDPEFAEQLEALRRGEKVLYIAKKHMGQYAHLAIMNKAIFFSDLIPAGQMIFIDKKLLEQPVLPTGFINV